jgi:hypothetical protein
MMLREELNLVYTQRICEIGIGNSFKAIKTYSEDYIKNKIRSSWSEVKDALDSDEKRGKFLDFLSSVLDKKFSSIEEVDSVFKRLDEDATMTLNDVKDFLVKNSALILGLSAIILEVAQEILGSANLVLALLYVIISLMILLSQNTEKAQTYLKSIRKKIEAYLDKTARAFHLLRASKKIVGSSAGFPMNKKTAQTIMKAVGKTKK